MECVGSPEDAWLVPEIKDESEADVACCLCRDGGGVGGNEIVVSDGK